MPLDVGWDDNTVEDDDEEVRDFGYGGKEAIIFLIDASASMHVKPDCNDSTPFQMAVECALETLKRKVFSSPNDVVGVLLYGTREKVAVRDFSHLSVLLPLDTPEASSILMLEKLIEDADEFKEKFGSSDDYSLHEALWQCQSLFADVRGKTSYKKILLFTCNDNPHEDDEQKRRQARQKAWDLNETDAFLDILPLGDEFDVGKFYRDIIQLADDAEYESIGNPTGKFEALMAQVRKKDHKKRSLGRIHFDLGKGVKIGVSTFNFVQRAYKPPKVRLAKDTNEEVKLQRTFIDHETGAPLLPSDIMKYQEYGNRKIKFTQDEVRSIGMMNGEVGLKLVGFKPTSHLKWSHFVRSGYFIYPEDTIVKGSRRLFTALLRRCLHRDVMAICSYKSRDNSGPSFVALLPQAEETEEDGSQVNPPGFHLVFLPFSDDMRTVPDVKLVEPEPEQVDAAKNVIKKLRLKTYHPEAFENPDLQCHYALIEALALSRDNVEKPEDKTLPPTDHMRKKLGDLAEAFKESVYPDGYNPESAASKKKPAATKRKADDGGSTAAKKTSKVDVDTFDMESYVESKTVHKLTVDVLKSWLKGVNVDMGKQKKAELVQSVYESFKK